jgi:hypothetical protein
LRVWTHEDEFLARWRGPDCGPRAWALTPE